MSVARVSFPGTTLTRGADILACIGDTPLVRLSRVVRGLAPGVEVYGKAEWFNPGGSVKDRAALWMIEAAERDGLLTPDRIIVDATSGNTGIAYALIGAVKGYQVELIMPANVSQERVTLARAYGARAIFSDPLEGSDGAIRKARQLVVEHPEHYFYADQYNNPANPRAHYESTGPEIWRQTEGRVTHLVAGIGTSGTVMGTGHYLKGRNPDVQLVAVEPAEPLQVIEGLKHMATSIVPGIYDPTFPDRVIAVSAEDAWAMACRLARQEGLLVGISAGAAVHAALEVGRELDTAVVVVILPDGGDRYLSLGLCK